MTPLLVLLVLVVLTILMTVKVIPQQTAYIMERLGKFYACITTWNQFYHSVF